MSLAELLVLESVQIILPGPPRGKGRPRSVRTPAGFIRHYTDAKTEEHEHNLKLVAGRMMGNRNPLIGPLHVTMEAHFQVPQSWSKKKQQAALANMVRHTTKPDADNLLKVLDGLNGVVWIDDAQICELTLIKRYSLKPHTKIVVQAL